MKSKIPQVSIIVPVYNSAKYLKQTIDSIKSQTFKDYEVIFVDDKSTDESVSIIKDSCNLEEKFKLIELEKNNGAAIARNTGIAAARGRYICFMDSDDIWNSSKLSKQIKFMRNNSYIFSATNVTYTDKDENELFSTKYPKGITYKYLIKHTQPLTSSICIDTNGINKESIMMPNIQKGQDTATWWRILKSGINLYILEEPLVIYRQREQSLSHNKMKALKRTWDLYRNVAGFGKIKASYYFTYYLLGGVKKQIRKKIKI